MRFRAARSCVRLAQQLMNEAAARSFCPECQATWDREWYDQCPHCKHRFKELALTTLQRVLVVLAVLAPALLVAAIRLTDQTAAEGQLFNLCLFGNAFGALIAAAICAFKLMWTVAGKIIRLLVLLPVFYVIGFALSFAAASYL